MVTEKARENPREMGLSSRYRGVRDNRVRDSEVLLYLKF